METEVGVSTPPNERADLIAPYPPGVLDRFMAWADRLPGPVWVFYLVLLVVLVVIINAVAWLDGSAQFGTFDLYRSSIPIYPVCVLALIHYLNAWQRASPPFVRFGRVKPNTPLRYELTTLPQGKTLGVLGLSLPFTAAFTWFMPNITNTFRLSPGLVVVDTFFMYRLWVGHRVCISHAAPTANGESHSRQRKKREHLSTHASLCVFGAHCSDGDWSAVVELFLSPDRPHNLCEPRADWFNGLYVARCSCVSFTVTGCNRIVSEKKRLLAEANARLEATVNKSIARRRAKPDETIN
jgi:hypothetical protein